MQCAMYAAEKRKNGRKRKCIHIRLGLYYFGYFQKRLKPQDSFGEFNNKKFLIFRKTESAGNHKKTPSDLPAIVWNDIS